MHKDESLSPTPATGGSGDSIHEESTQFSTVEKSNDATIRLPSEHLVGMQKQAGLIIDSGDATSFHDIDLQNIDLNNIDLNSIDLRDIDIDNLQGTNITEVLAALQKQRTSAPRNEHNTQQNVEQTATQDHGVRGVGGGVIHRAYVVNKEPVHEGSHRNSTTERLIGEPRPTINEQSQHHHTNSAGAGGPNTQISTDDGTLEFNVDELDERKLFELQNVIRELEGNAAFEQLLDGIKPQPAAPNNPAESAIQSTSLNSNVKPQLINSGSGATNVNIDQIPQEAVYMSIGRLLDTDNVDMSSLSQGTQEQLMWLVNRLNNNRNHQDEDEDEADEEDYDKSKRQARIREENRERKKRWREINQDRNKDNDLRCRVTKRATKLYGVLDTKEKKAWMEAEFQKRKEKREAKERARFHDDRLSTPCFQSYPQQNHNRSGGSSATLSPSLQALPQTSPLDSSENSAGISRNRENSVAESTTSSINDGDSPDTVGALNFLSDPETARKLLENPEAMELLSKNLEVLSFLRSVIGSKEESCPEGKVNGNFVAPQRATDHQLYQKSSIAPNLAAIGSIPDVGAVLKKQRPQAPLDTKSAIDISIYFELSMPELEAKLETIGCEAAQKVITELLNFHKGEAAVHASSLNMSPNPGALCRADGEDHGTALDRSVVNDKLIPFPPNLDHDVSIEHTNGSPDNLDPSVAIDASSEPVDISTKLLQALQGVLGGNLAETAPLSGSVMACAPPVSQTSNRNKRTAPDVDQSLLLRKRHQSSPTTLVLADTSVAFTGFDETASSHLAAPVTPCNTTPCATLINTTAGVLCTPSSAYSPSRTIPKPPVSTSRDRTMSAAAAHAASFGNSAAMNQRLMPAPPYRPPNLGISYGGFSPTLTTPKKKADERLVKAMGFPPMLAGIGKKSTSL